MQTRAILDLAMKTLSIEARTAQSARGLSGALADFRPVVIEQDPETFVVRVDLSQSGAEIASLLTAIQKYVTERESGSARIDLDGRTYVMDAPR